MQSAVGPLLLITSAVLLTCITVGYAADLAAQALTDPQAYAEKAYENLQDALNNQTSSLYNQTQIPLQPEFDDSPPNP